MSIAEPRIWTLRADGGFDGPRIGPSLTALIRGEPITDEEYEDDSIDAIEMAGAVVYGVWERDGANDILIGLHWKREDADSKAHDGSFVMEHEIA